MTRYADPLRCPDCRATIAAGAPACASCSLPLRGEDAQQLFLTLSRADALLAALRGTSPSLPPSMPPSRLAPMPVSRREPLPRRARAGLSAASVPTILLTLGAGCLLVAALVFLAVAWSALGVGGRTATLVACTAVAGGLSAWAARRGLRAATESLALVGFGLLALDVVGADHAGWLGDLSTGQLLELLGAVLALAGAGGAMTARRGRVPALTGSEVVCAVGTASAAGGIALCAEPTVATALVAATLAGAAATAAAHRFGLRVAAVADAAVTAAAWSLLTAYALTRTLEHDDGWRDLWLGRQVWPLLVAAALVAGLVLLRRLPTWLRVGALAVAELLAADAALAPVEHLDGTSVTLVGLGLLVVTGAATWLLPRPWGLVNALTQVVGSVGVLVVGVALTGRSADRLLDAAGPGWSGRAGDLLPGSSAGHPAGWLLPLCVVVLVGTGWALAEGSSVVERLVAPVGDLRVGAGLLAVASVAALALYPVPVWLVLVALLVATAGFTTWWLVGASIVPLGLGTLFVACAVVLSLHAVWLTAFVLVAALAFTGSVQLRGRASRLASTGGALLAATVAGAAWAFGAAAHAEPAWAVLVGLLVLGAVVLLAPYAPSRWWACTDPVAARTGLEAGAAGSVVPLGAAGVLLAPTGLDVTWGAVYLTVAGAVGTVMALVRADRRGLVWPGGLLLAAASWVRLWDLGVGVPEAYSLPSASVLLGVGLDRLRRDRLEPTMTALAAGLSLALVPSLLWTLTDPTGLRALLLGVGCLLLVLVGARLGWTAPVVLGAGVGALLVLRLAAPYIGEAVPRWVLIGAAGALLIGVGATWERRLTDARQLAGRVRAMR